MRLSIVPPSFNFNPTNSAQLPWQSSAACFLILQSTQPSCCCDLAAVAVPSQVAAFLGESFQIKTFSQKTLKLRCRRALNERRSSFLVHTGLWGNSLEGAQPCFIRLVLPNMQHFFIWMYNKSIIVNTTVCFYMTRLHNVVLWLLLISV